jgi:hypothetical protein
MTTVAELIRKYVYSASGRSINARMNEVHLRNNGYSSPVDEMLKATSEFSDMSFTERLRMFVFDKIRHNVCNTCGVELRIWDSDDWKRFCSKKCAQSHPDTKAKVASGQKSIDWDVAIEKRKQSMLERHGVEYYSQTESAKQAFVERTKIAWATSEQKQARLTTRKQTNIERYGYEHNLSIVGARESAVIKSSETKRKHSQERKIDIADKYRKSVCNSLAFDVITSKKAMTVLYDVDKLSIIQISNEFDVHRDAIERALIRFNIQIDNVREQSSLRSHKETSLFMWIQSICPSAVQSSRHGRKQMDILVPEKRLIIEFNGVYWHSDAKLKTHRYHQMKHDYFVCAGYRYVQIWEDDWDRRTDTVKMFLTNLIGANCNRIGARRTTVVSLNTTEYKTFMETHHMQGESNASIRYGLMFDSKVVAAIGFIKDNDGYNLVRYANTNVTGAFSKLLTTFNRNYSPKWVKTFGDLEIVDQFDNVYLQNGFVEQYKLSPDYRYFNRLTHKREHKFAWRKSKFKRIGYDVDNYTEHELSKQHGLLRCWDSGKVCYIKHYS